ncbi:hypothetical protein [Hyphomicrobium sp.]|uniref:hypothetical protein n=1 Tax=Hyphomicrobium sp. TaxID=82 RepID=UPI0025C52923|nr:hypothetical protein [Hyphomicrobium sp.]
MLPLLGRLLEIRVSLLFKALLQLIANLLPSRCVSFEFRFGGFAILPFLTIAFLLLYKAGEAIALVGSLARCLPPFGLLDVFRSSPAHGARVTG